MLALYLLCALSGLNVEKEETESEETESTFYRDMRLLFLIWKEKKIEKCIF